MPGRGSQAHKKPTIKSCTKKCFSAAAWGESEEEENSEKVDDSDAAVDFDSGLLLQDFELRNWQRVM